MMEFDVTQRISSVSIAVMGAVCILLVIMAVIAFLFVRNNYPKNNMPIVWGALGYYLGFNCFFKLVYIGEGFLQQAIQQAEDASAAMVTAYSNIVSIVFTVIFSMVFVVWTWAFYRFFILIKDRSTMGKAVSAGFGFALLYMLESFVTMFSNWLYARLYNNTTYEVLTENMKPDEIESFQQFLSQFFNYKPYEFGAVVFENLAFLFLIFSVMVMLHTFLSKKEARSCFFRAICLVLAYYLVGALHSLGAIPSALIQIGLQVIIAAVGTILALRWLHQYCLEDFDYLAKRLSKGALSMAFYKEEKKDNFKGYHKINK